MFKNINIHNYDFDYDLHISEFLRDALLGHIDFRMEINHIPTINIYKKIGDKYIPMTLDELIYFIHYDISKYIFGEIGKSPQRSYTSRLDLLEFKRLFGSIKTINKAIDDMRILLTFEPQE
tara:strand:- start:676 stop:1038 length:363 start_codon:yes stop_codon:yes gene_type:complete